ncbi:coiled-coil domain-containing protein SCD2-like isoform X2 [Zingiber officinale]|uniref:coiled-coil domain-containing protein SCD2-like isoform X2 n=1 Tax=Zingiber officinale TaxID=94328 RepID=UPI001C4BAC58|nr:coiled-coil domain-containing protein SCD2-like isoform X2 [Zingiber officinale]
MEHRIRRTPSPALSRRSSAASSGSTSGRAMPPEYPRSSSISCVSGVKRTQNLAAKAANARLALVMASHTSEDEEDDDLVPDGAGTSARTWFGLTRPVARAPSPALGRNVLETAPVSRSISVGRPTLRVPSAPMMPQTKTTITTPSSIPNIDPAEKQRDKRFFPDMRHVKTREHGELREASALQDKLDMLEEENYSLLEKLQLAEERWKEAEIRSRELEKQVTNLGEGVSLEARLLSRKEAVLRQREEALKSTMRSTDDKSEELISLRQQLQFAKDEVTTVADQLRGAELEVKALRSMTQRMILTQEEMEEVVLKRCWLARYWALAVQYGIYPEVATAKNEYWSSLAPLPLEVVTSAGQRAKKQSLSNGYLEPDWRNKQGHDISDTNAEGNIENMLAVEKGLRELSSLKVEDAIVLVLAQYRRPNLLRQTASDIRSPGDPKFMEEFELSEEEAEDVLFKQSWLTYFWRRSTDHGIEEDIAEERLQFWIDSIGQAPTPQDVVDVERGLIELRKLGIEQQLWEASRWETNTDQKPR